MKQVIDLLRLAHRHLNVEDLLQSTQMYMIAYARGYIASAIAALQPRWETPKQWEKRTGESWPDNGAVYIRENGELRVEEYWRALQLENDLIRLDKDFGDHHVPLLVLCATEAGPPPDGWVPEEEAQ